MTTTEPCPGCDRTHPIEEDCTPTDWPPTPYMTIEEALAVEGDWHGIEPCWACGHWHTPIWWHVDFEEDSHLGEMLRERRTQVLAVSEEDRAEWYQGIA